MRLKEASQSKSNMRLNAIAWLVAQNYLLQNPWKETRIEEKKKGGGKNKKRA